MRVGPRPQSNWISPTRNTVFNFPPEKLIPESKFRIDSFSTLQFPVPFPGCNISCTESDRNLSTILFFPRTRRRRIDTCSFSQFLEVPSATPRAPAIEATVKSATGADRRGRRRHRLLRSMLPNGLLV